MKSNDEPLMTRQEIMYLLLGRPEAKPIPKAVKAGAATIYRRPLATARETKPLGPAEQRARGRWHKPVAAIIADALASNRGLLERLGRGVRGPNMKHKEQYQVIFNGLYQTTQEQIEALEVFTKVDWSE